MPADRRSATFAALADPTRRAIPARLASGETTVTALADREIVAPGADVKPANPVRELGSGTGFAA